MAHSNTVLLHLQSQQSLGNVQRTFRIPPRTLTCNRSVIGRFLHSSLWPIILGTDSAATVDAGKSVLILSIFRIFTLALVSLAAILTPLGLYEDLVGQTDSPPQPFHYIIDPSVYGLGTALRTPISGKWSRICGYSLPYACPHAPYNITQLRNSTLLQADIDTWLNTTIPQNVIDEFQSGLVDFQPSVSSAFDIQYRSYILSTLDLNNTGILPDNGTTPFTKGAYQALTSLILSDSYLAVEGLIVDMKNGGIGFRNHTAPRLDTHGSTWSEDLLFASLETACVDTNLTIDFHIPKVRSQTYSRWGEYALSLTDRGGFVNFNRTPPSSQKDYDQSDSGIWMRAYRAAWANKALTMMFMNVTNPTSQNPDRKAFAYLTSTLNQSYPLHYPNGEQISLRYQIHPNMLRLGSDFGEYLIGTDVDQKDYTTSNITTVASSAVYSNPYNISAASSFADTNATFHNSTLASKCSIAW